MSASSQTAAQSQPQAVFTEEDYRLMEMPYVERLAYLEQRLKDLVYEMHGIVIEESLTADKAASAVSTGAGHAVCIVDPEDGNLFNEELQVDEVTAGTTWQLHFLERLSGDCDFNHAVSIADITPIAIYFGDEYVEGEGWPRDYDPHLDRVTSSNLSIGIEDITPIAMYYGLELEGYNVYRQRGEGDERLIADWRDYDVPPPPERGRRGRRK